MQAKRELLHNLQNHDQLVGMEAQTNDLRDIFRRCFIDGNGQCVLLIGPNGSGKSSLLNKICKEFGPIVLRVSGMLSSDDISALNSLAKQLGVRLGLNYVGYRAVDALNFFKQNVRYSHNILIIIEDVHEFTHGTAKQILLYTLFELLHEEICKLCIAITTQRLDVTELMEKRIRSRFSNQTIMTLGLSPFDILRTLQARLVSSDNEWTTKAQECLPLLERQLDLGYQLPAILSLFQSALLRSSTPQSLLNNFTTLIKQSTETSRAQYLHLLSQYELTVMVSLCLTYLRKESVSILRAYNELQDYLKTSQGALLTFSFTWESFRTVCNEMLRKGLLKATKSGLKEHAPLSFAFEPSKFLEQLKSEEMVVPTSVLEWINLS
jgi:hypothetical protein